MEAVDRPRETRRSARDAPRPGAPESTPPATRGALRTAAARKQSTTSAPLSRRSGVRARPAVALLLAGVLAGTGAGAVWSASSVREPVGTVSSAGTAEAEVPRVDARASRDDVRETVDGSGAGSVLSANPLDTDSLEAVAAARPGAQGADSAPAGTDGTDGTGASDVTAGAGTTDAAGTAEGTDADGAAEVPGAVDTTASEVQPPAAPVLPEGVDEVGFAAGMLSTVVPADAGGVLEVVPGTQEAPGTGEVLTVRVQVEAGLDVDGTKVADLVLSTLNDARSWGGDGSRTFARTDAPDATFTVTLASPATVDRLCAPLDTGGLWSCGVTDHAVLNYLRWVEGSPNYGADMVAYRQYLVNHEVGHVLGHRHEQCGATTDLAPVMVQQSGATIRCVPNGWPFP